MDGKRYVADKPDSIVVEYVGGLRTGVSQKSDTSFCLGLLYEVLAPIVVVFSLQL
jgi:hypothetical protein